jgi:hypothetical protein
MINIRLYLYIDSKNDELLRFIDANIRMINQYYIITIHVITKDDLSNRAVRNELKLFGVEHLPALAYLSQTSRRSFTLSNEVQIKSHLTTQARAYLQYIADNESAANGGSNAAADYDNDQVDDVMNNYMDDAILDEGVDEPGSSEAITADDFRQLQDSQMNNASKQLASELHKRRMTQDKRKGGNGTTHGRGSKSRRMQHLVSRLNINRSVAADINDHDTSHQSGNQRRDPAEREMGTTEDRHLAEDVKSSQSVDSLVHAQLQNDVETPIMDKQSAPRRKPMRDPADEYMKGITGKY